MSQTNTYKKTVKSTLVFGGVQVTQLLLTMIKAKIIAVFLGPLGMGVNALFQSAFGIISQLSSLGVYQSGVRNISISYQDDNRDKIKSMLFDYQNIVILVSFLGLLLCLILSPFMSRFLFGDYKYLENFLLLSIAVFFYNLGNGKIAKMQGARELFPLAKSSLFTALFGLIFSIPFYYFLGVNGIVYSFIFSNLSFLLVNLYYSRYYFSLPDLSAFKKSINNNLNIFKLGVTLMMSGILMTLFSFILNGFISSIGNLEDVGFFQSASSISYQNVSIFVAVLSAEFYPRLSAIVDDKLKMNEAVNQQLELGLLIIAPASILLMVLAPLVVRILLSDEFAIIIPMLRFMSISLLFRGIWHTLSYLILAKGDTQNYFVFDALLGNGIVFILNMIAYYWANLQGLGISFVVGSIVMVLILFFLVSTKYQFRLQKSFKILFTSYLGIVIFSYFLITYSDSVWSNILSLSLALFSVIISLIILDKRISVFSLLRAKFRK